MLKKKDLEAVLDDYPDAKRILNARARKLINENAEQNKKEMAARNNVIFEQRRDQIHASICFVIQNNAIVVSDLKFIHTLETNVILQKGGPGVTQSRDGGVPALHQDPPQGSTFQLFTKSLFLKVKSEKKYD